MGWLNIDLGRGKSMDPGCFSSAWGITTETFLGHPCCDVKSRFCHRSTTPG